MFEGGADQPTHREHQRGRSPRATPFIIVSGYGVSELVRPHHRSRREDPGQEQSAQKNRANRNVPSGEERSFLRVGGEQIGMSRHRRIPPSI
jgi:hypothetical protein